MSTASVSYGVNDVQLIEAAGELRVMEQRESCRDFGDVSRPAGFVGTASRLSTRLG